ncbi:MAG: tetratricopeptide repeat protein [Deltaproteobacteria bacterium]|nr:tetratricopeptide repeat protein [Deltaproteobacteria bacterium]
MSKPTPADAPKLASLAHAVAADGDFGAAQAAAQMATTADPKCFDAWVMLGLAHAKQNKPSRAAPCFVKALELRPDDVACWTDLGECLTMLMDYPRAAAAFRQAMLLDPNADHPSGRRARAVVGRTIALLRKG